MTPDDAPVVTDDGECPCCGPRIVDADDAPVPTDLTGERPTAEHHILKCDSPFWGDVARGDKTFEIRKNDRNFRLGDTLCLRDWLPDRGLYRHEVTGKQESIVHARVGYICYSGMSGWFGLKPGYVAMGLTDVRIALNHGPGTNDGSDA
jgi:hypothetical protein